jgi:hypothetical protein
MSLNRDKDESSSLPAFWAVALVRLTAAGLPTGVIRDRYRDEFLADLHGMTRREQANYSTQVLAHAIPLRVAVRIGYRRSLVKGSDMVFRRSRPLLCRLNLRHHWHTESTEDGALYARCIRCGKDATGPTATGTDGDITAHAANLFGLGGGF